MTWALCLNCGDVKFGAICPCPSCRVASTGDMQMDIAFSDHHIPRAELEQFGAVIKAIAEVSDEDELKFWSFILFISESRPETLAVTLEPVMESRAREVLERARAPGFESG